MNGTSTPRHGHDTGPDPQQTWDERQQYRAHLVQMLDEVRRQQELVTVNRARYLVLADRYGMTAAEIAELVNMSASGVRKAIRLARDTPETEVAW